MVNQYGGILDVNKCYKRIQARKGEQGDLDEETGREEGNREVFLC